MKLALKAVILLIVLFLAAHTVDAQTDVIIAIDLSKSMQDNDPNGNRFIGADQFMTMFSLYGSNRGGVVAFGNGASVVIQLEHLSFDQAKKYKPVLDKLGYEDWTELGLGIKLSQETLGQSGRRKSIVLISDGIVEGNPHSRGVSADQARAQAERELWGSIVPALKRQNISVYTIGLFSATNSGEPVLQKIAAETGGFYTHVNKPEEFSQIYKKMLDDIGQPAGVAELTNDKNSIVLTPADEGVIVFGPLRFVVKSPNNVSYTTDKETPDTPVKQKFVEYSNGIGILFLGRPDNIAQNEQFWTGRWSVEGLSGPGEATYISNIRMNRSQGLPPRREFFLNEYYPIEYRFDTQPGFDSEAFLSKCRAEYLIIPQSNSAGRPVSGTITREGNNFKGEQLLEHEGDYILKVKVLYQGVEKWSPPLIHFHVNKTPLVEVLSPSGEATKGENFRIEVKENVAAFTSFPADIRGLSPDSLMTFTLRYGNDQAIPFDRVGIDRDGIYRTKELQYKKSGDLEIEGVLNGKLIVQKQVENGEPTISHYDIKTRFSKKLTVGPDYWAAVVYPVGGSIIGLISLVASVLGIVGWIQRPKIERLDRAALMGSRTISLKPEKKHEWARMFAPAAVTIGGPGSEADVIDASLNNGGSDPVMEISVDRHGNYQITRKSNLDVYLNNQPLEMNDPQPLNQNDQVFVNEMKFKFMD